MKVRHVRVGELLQLRRDLVRIDPAETYAPIGVRSFANGLIRYPSCTGAELSKMRYFKLPPDSLVFSNIKAWEGAVALTSGDDNARVVSNRFLTYTPRTKDVCLRYIWHYFASDLGTRQLAQASPGSADRNRTLGIKAFDELLIPLPDPNQQRAIASRLDAYHSVTTSVALGKSSRIEVSLRERVISRSYGSEARPIGEILRPTRDWISPQMGSKYTPIGVHGFGRGLIRYPPTECAELSKLRYYKIPGKSLIVSNIKAWEGAIALAEESDTELIASNRFLCYELLTKLIDLEFVQKFFLSSHGLATLGDSSPGSADRNRTLSIDSFEKIPVPVPPLGVQIRIVSELRRMDELDDARGRRVTLASALPQAARNEVFSKLL